VTPIKGKGNEGSGNLVRMAPSSRQRVSGG
jgi:hypothetical protein